MGLGDGGPGLEDRGSGQGLIHRGWGLENWSRRTRARKGVGAGIKRWRFGAGDRGWGQGLRHKGWGEGK